MVYAALMRGINVGGKHRVKMDELKDVFAESGMQAPRTYIQSGNVVFRSDRQKAEIKEILTDAFEKKFGFRSEIILLNFFWILKISLSTFHFLNLTLKLPGAWIRK